MHTTPLWNPATLPELVGNNPALHQRLIEKFLSTAECQVNTVLAAVADKVDTATIAAVAHTLKSNARSVGALRLGALCQDLENAGLAADNASCRQLAAELVGAWTAARVAASRPHCAL